MASRESCNWIDMQRHFFQNTLQPGHSIAMQIYCLGKLSLIGWLGVHFSQ